MTLWQFVFQVPVRCSSDIVGSCYTVHTGAGQAGHRLHDRGKSSGGIRSSEFNQDSIKVQSSSIDWWQGVCIPVAQPLVANWTPKEEKSRISTFIVSGCFIVFFFNLLRLYSAFSLMLRFKETFTSTKNHQIHKINKSQIIILTENHKNNQTKSLKIIKISTQKNPKSPLLLLISWVTKLINQVIGMQAGRLVPLWAYLSAVTWPILTAGKRSFTLRDWWESSSLVPGCSLLKILRPSIRESLTKKKPT